jgi:carbonic anhydrase
VQEAWHRGQPLAVHGWIYRLQDGRLREMGIDIHDNGELAALQSASPDGRG